MSPIPCVVALPIHLSVYLSVRKVYCGKTADWIRMPFAVVSGVGREMCILDGATCPKGRAGLGFFRSHWFEWRILTEMYSTRT